MATTQRRWARHVHLRAGALKGWCAKCPSARRHAALRSAVKKGEYGVVVRRLNFLRHVADREHNPAHRTVAGRDARWMGRVIRQNRQVE
jgi:hypothetical protein